MNAQDSFDNFFQSPDVKAFSEVNFIPVNEYTGRNNVVIPIYSISLDGLEIPISISYNSAGVKVNDFASSVGMNWSLNAGGNIVKEINGIDDYKLQIGPSANVVGFIGYMSQPNKVTGNGGAPYTYFQEGTPDYYYASAPGLGSQFITKRLSPATASGPSLWQNLLTGHELKNNGNIIKLNYAFFNSNLNVYETPSDLPSGSWNYSKNVVDINVISNRGYTYDFKKFDLNVTQNYSTESGYSTSVSPTSYKLTSIASPKSNKVVSFEYEKKNITGLNLNLQNVYYTNGNLDYQNALLSETIISNKIKKIVFEEGEVLFEYNTTRLDIPSEKGLSKIIIKNSDNLVIQEINFIYENIKSVENCNDDDCNRLFLKEVAFKNSSNAELKSYGFEYNTTKLPKRFSYKQDFLGYYNNATSSHSTKFVPTVYHHEGQGKYSFSPISLNSNYQALYGTYSLASSETYSKAGILNKIIYPTGGYSTFEYGLNQFKYNNTLIDGGGLRIEKNKLHDSNGSIVREVVYDYKLTNNETSGSVLYLPRFADYDANDGNIRIFQRNVANQRFTKNSYVGYSRVKISESNNGYIIKEFTSPASNPNVMPSISNGNFTNNTAYLQSTHYKKVSNGCFSNIVIDENDILRGQLTSLKVYDDNNSLVKETINTYTFKGFTNILTVSEVFKTQYFDTNGDGWDPPTFPYISCSVNLAPERNLLTHTLTKDFLTGGTKITNQYLDYDPDYPFITEQRLVDPVSEIKTNTFYPYDTEVNSLPYMSNLVTQNRISVPIKEEIRKDNLLVNTSISNYNDFGNGLILSKSQSTAKANESLIEETIIDIVDAKGNIKQYHNKIGVYTSIVWGYDGLYPIAKIENATYANVEALGSFGTNFNITTSLSTTQEADLRNLPNTIVTTYTYNPMVGITSVTDPKGYITTYEYDEFNRLEQIKDADGKVLSHNKYHYKNQ